MRETLLAAVRARLRRIEDTDEAAPSEAELRSAGAMLDEWCTSGTDGVPDSADLDEAVSLFWGVLEHTPASHPRRAGLLSGLGLTLKARHERTGSATDLNAAVVRLAQAVQGLPLHDRRRATAQSALGTLLNRRFTSTRSTADLDAAIARLEEAARGLAASGGPLLAATTHELGCALRTRYAWGDDVADLEAALLWLSEALDATASDDPARGARSLDLGEAHHRRFRSLGAATDLDAAVGRHADAVEATPVDAPERVTRLSQLGVVLWERFRLRGQASDLDTAVDCQLEALRGTSADGPDRSRYLLFLGTALHTRYGARRDSEDLDACIDRYRESLAALPAGDSGRAMRLLELGRALDARFAETEAAADLDEAIACHREAVRRTRASAPRRANMLAALGNSLHTRYAAAEEPADLDEAVSHLRESVRDTRADEAAAGVHSVGLALAHLALYERSGEPADLDEAVHRYEQAIRYTPAGLPEHMARVTLLGDALRRRYGATADTTDLDAAVRAYRDASQGTPRDDPAYAPRLSSLGLALETRSEANGGQADLDEAIAVHQEVVGATPPDHPERGARLMVWGRALCRRHDRTGAPADLDEGIRRQEEGVRTTPADHSLHGVRLTALGMALYSRYERTGSLPDLDAAISRQLRALETMAAGDPARVRLLEWLGATHSARSRRTGTLADADRAVSWYREAVEATSGHDPEGPGRLADLGTALVIRFSRAGDPTDLDEAVRHHEDAVASLPEGHAVLPDLLNALGSALHARYERTRAARDLRRTVECYREAVRLSGAVDAPRRAMTLANLGRALWSRYERSTVVNVRDDAERAGLRADLETAIGHFREAVRITAADRPERAPYLMLLGDALAFRHERTGETADLEAMASAWEEAWTAGAAVPSVRVTAAWRAARALGPVAPGKAAEAAEAAVKLLPRISPRRLERDDQQHALGRFSGLAAEAAALALADDRGTSGERAARALRSLEAGRGVLIGQAMDVRGDLSDLRVRHPEPAARFIRLRDLLDQPSETSRPETGEGLIHETRSQAVAEDRIRLVAEFEETLAEIRGLEGHSAFALPPSAEALTGEAAEGPVVVFNVSRHRGDALLLTKDGIAHTELPELTAGAVARRAREFRQALIAATGADRAARKQAQATLVAVNEWLWDAAAGPVLDALGLRGRPVDCPTAWPRVWWVPGGLLGQLPLHAAGHHFDPAGAGRRTVMDRVVSSYTPTVRALSRARELTRRQQRKRSDVRSLIVAMPTTPGLPGEGRLGFVDEEVAAVRDYLPHPVLLREGHPEDVGASTASARTPTRERVLALLPQCSIAHFACHGASHPTDPSKSLLFLHDHVRDPLTVAGLTPVRLDRAELAYLSACRTAVVEDDSLADEAIHVASAFQLAGFPQVIGTLWEIDDDTAVTVAAAVYSGLLVGPDELDPRRAAFALHGAVRTVRDMLPGVPSLWAGYLHSGA
ncbi:CHAT domain-containing protein [Streptomyces sp. NPDC005752]|uniref:CHAT domain-containing protein n=1 Tax=Streptomyces sp. NPDC005752 TaxID=3157065 RepID=UPI0033F2C6AA